MTEWERLVYEAKEKCAGCRESWALVRGPHDGEGHRLPSGKLHKCEALEIRRQIRALTPASG